MNYNSPPVYEIDVWNHSGTANSPITARDNRVHINIGKLEAVGTILICQKLNQIHYVDVVV